MPIRLEKEEDIPQPVLDGPNTWVKKFFGEDPQARLGVALLDPAFEAEDQLVFPAEKLGIRTADLGVRLFNEGSLPGIRSWKMEESPEWEQSVARWRESLVEVGVDKFDELVQDSARLAEEAYEQMGNLAPRLACLRWNCAITWIAARSETVTKVSIGNSFGQVPVPSSERANREAKKKIFGWLRSLCKEPKVRAIFDFDLVGHGVWHNAGKEPIPKEANDEWYRRGVFYDIVLMVHQTMLLPPEDMNPSAPTLLMLKPYGTPDWDMPPSVAPEGILKQHAWTAVPLPAPIRSDKANIQGKVLHCREPPPIEADLDDPEVIAKIQRGEPLGKGLQEDGLPGALHGSVGLVFAAYCHVANFRNVKLYPGLLELDGFLQYFLRYCPPLRTLDLGSCHGVFDNGHFKTLNLVGSRLKVLDLENCNMRTHQVEETVQLLSELTGMVHLDLANNKLDTHGAMLIVSLLAEKRVDIASVRLDGNPFGDQVTFRNALAGTLAERGEGVLHGGELVPHFTDDAVVWYGVPRDGTLAYRMRGEGEARARAVPLKDVKRQIEKRKEKLDEYESNDPAAKTVGGRDWLARQRVVSDAEMANDMVAMYRGEVKARIAAKKAAEEKAAAEKAREEEEAARKEEEEQQRSGSKKKPSKVTPAATGATGGYVAAAEEPPKASELPKTKRGSSKTIAPKPPKRPGMPYCNLVIREGHCPYGKTCQYDHPEEAVCKRNTKGLPQRPGQNDCPYYMQTRYCQSGWQCKWNHPGPEMRPWKPMKALGTYQPKAGSEVDSDADSPRSP